MADRIKGITIEIGGDTTGLNKALSGVNSEIRNTQSQLKDVERLLKLDPSNTELLSQKQKLLAQAVSETKGKLETLKEAEKQAEEQFKQGKISQEQYDALKREIVATEQQLKSLETQAGKANVTLQKIGQAGEKVKEFGGNVTAAGQEFSKLSAGVTAVGVASVAAWKSIDGAYDAIAKGTGATGEALEDLQKSFDNVFSSIPTQADTAGIAIADINTRFGFTGKILEDCSRSFIRFAEVNNTDVSQAVANVSRYMGDAGIESSKYGEVLDQLTAASQASGISIDKLTENLTKYGAPMRALGFDTKESIAIFAGWEKAGVNTEIAFSGMKKAIGTWGKEGKDAKEEFKKTLDEIARCPDIASATSKAIEVFGQKAGPDLADAIKGGRFAYEDFLTVLDSSAGQLERTFNDTLDPIDNVQVAIQAVTASGAKLGGEILSTIAPMLTSLAEKLKEAAEWFNGLDENQKKMIVTVGLVVAAAGPLLIMLGTIITSVGSIMTAISGMGALLTALSAGGGPIMLVVAAGLSLVAVLDHMTSSTDGYKKEAQALTEQEAENKTKVDELYASYDLLNEQRNSSVAGVQAQAQHEQTLFRELQGITDANGKVKAGEEERAAFILGELSSALGTEISMTGNQIENYGELCNSLDQVILKKQANALLSANEAAYAEAITNQTTAFIAYNDAQKNVEDTKYKLNEAQRQQSESQSQLNALMDAGILTWEEYSYREAELTQKMNESKAAVEGYHEKLAEQEGLLNGAEQAYVGYNTTISNYEGLSSAIITGDQQKISDAVLMTANNFQTAEMATKQTLERQVQEFSDKYAEMQSAVNAGAPGVTQSQVDNMKSLVELSKQELDRLPGVAAQSVAVTASGLVAKASEFSETGRKTGQNYSAGMAGGISDGGSEVISSAEEVASAGVQATKNALDSHSPSRVTHEIGLDFDAGLSGGIEEGATQVTGAVTKVAAAATQTLSTSLASSQVTLQAYQTTTSASWSLWASGLSSSLDMTLTGINTLTNSNMDTIEKTINTFLDEISRKWEEDWKDISKNHETSTGEIEKLNKEKMTRIKDDSLLAFKEMNDGINVTLKGLFPIVQGGVDPAVKHITDLIPKSHTWGTDMMDGFIRGIKSKMQELERACKDAADTVSDYLHFTRPEKGPLRYYEEWMPHMMQGLAAGVEKNRHLLTEQMNTLANDMALTIPDTKNMAKQPVTLKNHMLVMLDGKVVSDTVNEQLGILL